MTSAKLLFSAAIGLLFWSVYHVAQAYSSAFVW